MMRKIFLLTLFICISGASFGQNNDRLTQEKLAKVQEQITKEIRDSSFGSWMDKQFPGVKVYPLSVLSKKNIDAINKYNLNFSLVYDFEVKTPQIEINPILLYQEDSRCLAMKYIHEAQHMADANKLASFGITRPLLTLDNEITAHSIQYAFIFEQMSKYGRDYYNNCKQDMNLFNLFHEKGYDKLLSYIYTTYANKIATSFNARNIQYIIDNYLVFEHKSPYIMETTKIGAAYLAKHTVPTAEEFFTAKEHFGWWYAISNESLEEILQGKNQKYNKYNEYIQEQLAAVRERFDKASLKYRII
ncbi:MAG: hypothetical protein LBL61_03225, partial [Elusimicrobiota bacterium]|nr:hypothetical protein [Elusimicrobiota bacterium]